MPRATPASGSEALQETSTLAPTLPLVFYSSFNQQGL